MIRCDNIALTKGGPSRTYALRVRCDLVHGHAGPHIGKLMEAVYTWHNDESDRPVQNYRRDKPPRCSANTTRKPSAQESAQLLRCRLHEGHQGHHIANLDFHTVRWLG
jgi:hypothetical protein